MIKHHNLAERLVKVASEIEQLVDYLWVKELEDFGDQLCDGNEAGVKRHIFNSAVKVANALSNYHDTPKGIANSEGLVGLEEDSR